METHHSSARKTKGRTLYTLDRRCSTHLKLLDTNVVPFIHIGRYAQLPQGMAHHSGVGLAVERGSGCKHTVVRIPKVLH